MLNKLLSFIRRYDLIAPGNTVICAVSGGADSVALLFALYLLKDKLGITLEAAHFNHRLRGEESDRDEAFVRELCDRYDIALHVGSAHVMSGKKGLEAAARDARYGYFKTLSGKIATAHTADDNAETVLMHLVRGTGLKGLGGIAPVSGNLIRPMLEITRRDVEDFLDEWCLSHITDSSNDTDAFLRNRIRHHVMPLLQQENPKLAENLSAMALSLREDENVLSSLAQRDTLPTVETLKTMPPALRNRALEAFLKRSGVKEPEQSHIRLAEKLVFSDKPSARAAFPGGVTIARNYDRLAVLETEEPFPETILHCPGEVELPGYRVICEPAEALENSDHSFTVCPEGQMVLRSRQSGDAIRLSGGTKQLKKLFIDKKIPAARRSQIPVLCDERGVLGVCGIGADLDRTAWELPAVTVRFLKKKMRREKTMERDIKQILLTEEQIQNRIQELGEILTAEYADKNPIVVGVLKGVVIFYADMIRQIKVPCQMDFMCVSSYQGTNSTGRTMISKDLSSDIYGRHVLILEDIFDTGNSLEFICNHLMNKNPASLKICTLLDKPERRKPGVKVQCDWVGFTIPNEFVVGYGLDYNEKYRNLPYVGILKPEVYEK